MPMAQMKTFTFGNGETIELYPINKLAEALGRKSDTVRKWEISGVLPKSLFKDSNGRRLYSQEQIDVIVNVAEETKIMQGSPISQTGFTKKCKKRLGEVNALYKAKMKAGSDEDEESELAEES